MSNQGRESPTPEEQLEVETPKDAGQKDAWESLAFQFCKIATFALVFQKYTFFAATVLAALTYWYVFLRGVKTTRCVLKKPLIVAIFWTLIAPIAAYFTFR